MAGGAPCLPSPRSGAASMLQEHSPRALWMCWCWGMQRALGACRTPTASGHPLRLQQPLQGCVLGFTPAPHGRDAAIPVAIVVPGHVARRRWWLRFRGFAVHAPLCLFGKGRFSNGDPSTMGSLQSGVNSQPWAGTHPPSLCYRDETSPSCIPLWAS